VSRIGEAVRALCVAADLDPNRVGHIEIEPGELRAEVLDRVQDGDFVTRTETRSYAT
jgi:hypothetical protein